MDSLEIFPIPISFLFFKYKLDKMKCPGGRGGGSGDLTPVKLFAMKKCSPIYKIMKRYVVHTYTAMKSLIKHYINNSMEM